MMENKELKVSNDESKVNGDSFPGYEPPKIVTYSAEELLETAGPAQACTTAPGCVITP